MSKKEKNGNVYMEIHKALYRLPQAGLLANKFFKQHLLKHEYYKVRFSPRIWKHISQPIQFTLVVDNFRKKYIGVEKATHLLVALQQNSTVENSWNKNYTAALQCNGSTITECLMFPCQDT